MDTKCQFGKVLIDLQMSDDVIYVSGRGYIHLAKIASNTTNEDLSSLLGKKLWNEEIRGVEWYKNNQEELNGRTIGLLLNKKMW